MRLHVPVVNARTHRDAAIFSSSGHHVCPPRRRTCSVAFPLRLACTSSTQWAPKANPLIIFDLTAVVVPIWRCPAMATPLCPPWTPPCTWSCLVYPVSYLNRCAMSGEISWWRRYRCWGRRRRHSPPVVVVAVGFDPAWRVGPPCQSARGEGNTRACVWGSGGPLLGRAGPVWVKFRKEKFFFFLFE
jgi:hypothetical protein